MKVLAIDTSNEICSVAILEDEKLIKEVHSDDSRQHSINLMPMIKKTLESVNLRLNDIELLGCGIGPGSFTGVRIGIATIKAFHDIKKIHAIGINSLEAQAYNVTLKKGKNDCKIISLIDAKNENAYIAVYRVHNGEMSLYKNPEIIKISSIIDYINFEEQVFIVGDVDKKRIDPLIQAKKAEELAQSKDVCEHEYINEREPLAHSIAIASFNKYNKKIISSFDNIEPMYLQKPQAERQKDGDDQKYIFEMSQTDLEEIENNYNDFESSWNLEILKQEFKNSVFFVMKSNNEIIGFIGIKTIMNEVEIMNIVTRKDKRNQGVASSLLSYVIRKIPTEKIKLEVNEHNINAINLYSEFGFKVDGERKGYYNGENAILMSL
ncbi:MAG: tRNA (adenosine(37)-N6)-threonylcarbamoyltransferase complex dimerization subunit type 1 TsaB [Clostridia bacterium]|nr:tRNA (adenosine(37)-N6)-threonylcarbamoyltransferase complex dimerization subunit type 1 TsaB [Clostridia bacterium]